MFDHEPDPEMERNGKWHCLVCREELVPSGPYGYVHAKEVMNENE